MGVIEWYRDVFDNRSDPRVKDWFLMSSPVPVVLIVALYLYVSLSFGPRYMKDRKPYSLRKVLILYNFMQVALNAFLVFEGVVYAWISDFSFRCHTIDYSDNPIAVWAAADSHQYFIYKIIDLLDTIFFILRKKDRQISFLHLYHHGGMVLGTWLGVKFAPGGQPLLMGWLNSAVHVIMYSYYMLAAMGPKVQKYLWWKRYLTIFQIVQFSIIFVHNAQTLFTGCGYPRSLSLLLTANALLFIYLFGSFYVQNYTKKVPGKRENNAVDGKESKKKQN